MSAYANQAAIEYFRKVLPLVSPEEKIQIMLKVGEINRRIGHHQAAVDAYTTAVDFFASDGMLLKGIAVCKIILELDPRHKEGERQHLAVIAVVHQAAGLHARNRWRLPVLLAGILFANGRRTVTSWLRAAGVSDDFDDYEDYDDYDEDEFDSHQRLS